MSTNSVAIVNDRKRCARNLPGGAVIALAAALLLGSVGTAAAHGADGPGRGPGYGMGPGMMMGPQGGQGYGMGPGMMMGPWGGQGYGMGPGMMMGPCGGQGYGMGPGMMMGPWGGQGYGMGPGMMMGPQGGQGYGMGPGMMGPQGGQGMMAPGARSGQPGKDLTADDVRARLEKWLARMGNPRLEVGEVEEVDEDTIVADIVTKEGKVVVDRFRINRHTGAMERVG